MANRLRAASSSPSLIDGGATLGVRLPNWLGDALLARRALDSLVAVAGPESAIFAAPRPIVSLLEPDYSGVRWIATSGHGPNAARGLGFSLKREHVDRLVLFPDSLSSRITGLYSGARERIGHGPRSMDLEALIGLTRRVPRRPRGERHLEEEYLDLARAVGGVALPARRLEVSRDAKARADVLLGDARSPLVLAPGARYGPAKRWSPTRFTQVARAWRGPVVLVGDEFDVEEAIAISQALEWRALNLAGKTDLPTLAAVLARAAVIVSNDSGVAHVAAALGRPTIVVFGSTDPRWTAPRGEHVTAIWDRVRCAPCFRTRCPYEDSYACLRIVESNRVIEALPR